MVSKLGGTIDDAIMYFGGGGIVAERMGYTIDYKYKANDGHYLLSSYELLFDNFLFANEIPHEVNKRICNKTQHRYDFKIGENYIEIWGFPDEPNNKIYEVYNEKRKIKEQLYKELNLNLIPIEESVFKQKSEKIEQEFKEIVLLCGYEVK